MTENPDLTLTILRHFARGDVGFPANITTDELAKQLNCDLMNVEYHVYCAIESDLLKANYTVVPTFGARGYNFSFIDGLTPAGDAYVKAAHSGGGSVWLEAKQRLTDAGLKITTKLLVEMLPRITGEIMDKAGG